jgi:outer membrane receptor protein involved in Fe transport
VDGIDVSSESIGVAGGSLLINPRLIDISQIEIVKGPQSALFGRSAFAGAISYTTLDPSDDVSGSASVDFSNRGQNEVKASISMPLGDTLGLRLNGYSFDDSGYYRNTVTGNKIGGGDGKGGSLSVKWQPTESYSMKFRTEYSDDNFDVPAQAPMPFNGTNAGPRECFDLQHWYGSVGDSTGHCHGSGGRVRHRRELPSESRHTCAGLERLSRARTPDG